MRRFRKKGLCKKRIRFVPKRIKGRGKRKKSKKKSTKKKHGRRKKSKKQKR